MLTKLMVVNECLASMGESGANSLNESNAFITSALNSLELASMEEQSAGWYFNIDKTELMPTVDGHYYVPTDTLSLYVGDSPNWLIIRARRLYNRKDGQYLLGTVPCTVSIVRHVPFEDLPFHAQRLIKAATVMHFQKSYDGDELKINNAQEEYQMARMLLMADHTRSVQANMLYHGPAGERIAGNRWLTNGYNLPPHRRG